MFNISNLFLSPQKNYDVIHKYIGSIFLKYIHIIELSNYKAIMGTSFF